MVLLASWRQAVLYLNFSAELINKRVLRYTRGSESVEDFKEMVHASVDELLPYIDYLAEKNNDVMDSFSRTAVLLPYSGLVAKIGACNHTAAWRSPRIWFAPEVYDSLTSVSKKLTSIMSEMSKTEADFKQNYQTMEAKLEEIQDTVEQMHRTFTIQLEAPGIIDCRWSLDLILPRKMDADQISRKDDSRQMQP